MEESKRLDRIGALKEKGTLRDREAIDWLERCLDDPEEGVQEAACRAIVEESLGKVLRGAGKEGLFRLSQAALRAGYERVAGEL